MKADIYPHAKAALDDIFAACDNEPLQVAKRLRVNDAHAYIYRKHKRITPKMRRRLEENGYVAPPKKRYRRHYEGGRGESGQRRVERVDAWLKRNGFESLTEAVDEIMEVE